MSAFEIALENVRRAIQTADERLVDRSVVIELVTLAAVAGEHVLIVGPPGTAKSHAVRSIAEQFRGHYFEYLLGRFTEPSELFGPIDLARLRTGEVAVQTAGMLPEAQIAFLDEVFLGSTAILNTLLGILNEHEFVRGHTRVSCPLRVCVGASNALPTEPVLEAFSDRFLLRAFVEPLRDEMLETLLARGARAETKVAPAATMNDLDELSRAAKNVDLGGFRTSLATAIRTLRAAGVIFSDRRMVKLQKLCAAAAVLRGSTIAGSEDLWPIVYASPTPETQEVAADALKPLLVETDNRTLASAAERASGSARMRATRLESELGAALAEGSVAPSRVLEALLREVDAFLAPEHVTATLELLRERARAAMAEPAPP